MFDPLCTSPPGQQHLHEAKSHQIWALRGKDHSRCYGRSEDGQPQHWLPVALLHAAHHHGIVARGPVGDKIISNRQKQSDSSTQGLEERKRPFHSLFPP